MADAKVSNLITPGRYEATLQSYGLGETKGGSPQFCAEFKIVEEGPFKNRGITWFGSLNEGAAMDITVKALTVMGMKSDDLSDENLLDKTKNYNLVIDTNTYVNGEGKSITNSKVKFINKLGGSGFKKTDDAPKVAQSLKDRIRASQIRAAQEGGGNNAPAMAEPAGVPHDDDIPF